MIPSKKHIVLITPGFPQNEMDTSCIPALQIYCNALRKDDNIRLSVISIHYPYTRNPYEWNGIKVYPLGFQNRLKIPFFSNRKVSRIIKDQHLSDPIDCLHSFWLGECSYVGYHFSKKYSIDHVTTLMGQDAKKGNRYAKLLPLKKMNVISVSEFQESIFYNNYGIRTKVIPWGVDDDQIPPQTEKNIDIIGIGSLISLKDHAEFINIIFKLKGDFPNINTVIIGEGELRTKLEQQIRDLGLERNIQLTGQLSYSETQVLLARSKILLHTSHYESFGMVFSEALACNTYIVSKKVGIAVESDHWFIGAKPDDLQNGCKKFLNSGNAVIPNYPRIGSTLIEYLQLYKI